MEKEDTGCTPGGGEDSMNVFYDAGLLFQSDVIGTADREGTPNTPLILTFSPFIGFFLSLFGHLKHAIVDSTAASQQDCHWFQTQEGGGLTSKISLLTLY